METLLALVLLGAAVYYLYKKRKEAVRKGTPGSSEPEPDNGNDKLIS